MIIGLSGYARTGKNEAAQALVPFGFEVVAFADKLREFLYALNPVVSYVAEDVYRLIGETRIRPVRLRDVIDTYGWNGYKETVYGDEIRSLIQRVGTDCGRDLISDTIWIDATLKSAGDQNIVVADCRFPNEAEAIKSRGGYIVRIERPGIGPVNNHPSETALDGWNWDFIIHNDMTVQDLQHDMVCVYDIVKRV